MQQQQLAQQAQQEQERAAQEYAMHQDKLLMDKYIADEKNRLEYTKLGMEGLNQGEDNSNEEARKLELEYKKLDEEMMFKMKELNETIRNNKAKEKIDMKKASKPTGTSSK